MKEADPRTLAKDPGSRALTDYREAQRLCDEAWPKIRSEIESAGIVFADETLDSALDAGGAVVFRSVTTGRSYAGTQPDKFGVRCVQPTPDLVREALLGFGRAVIKRAREVSASVVIVRSPLTALDEDALREGRTCFIRLRLVLTREVGP